MMASGLRTALSALIAAVLLAAPLAAQDVAPARDAAPAEVLVLGVYHFDNPGRDVVQLEIDDVLSPVRQAEIEAVVDSLARFRPTRIGVEREAEEAARMDSLYAAYRAGAHALERSEVQQIGFRLAARMGHPGLYAIDFMADFPFGPVMEYAQDHDPDFVAFAEAEQARIAATTSRRQSEHTIGEILWLENVPEGLAWDFATYLRFPRVGAGDTYVGAELLSAWYRRNVHIFANVQRIAEPGERVLVIIGAGHAPILRALIEADPSMRLADPLDYLPRP